MAKCNWCGDPGGNVIEGYHAGCLDAKQRVEWAKQAHHNRPATRRVRHEWQDPTGVPCPSEGYLDLLADFRRRMARRGIKI